MTPFRSRRWVRVGLPVLAGLALLGAAFFTGRSALDAGMDKLRSQASAFVSTRSHFTLHLGAARVVWFDRIEFREIDLRLAAPAFRLSAGRVTVVFDLWKILVRRSGLAAGLRDIRVSGLNTTVDTARLKNLTGEFRGLLAGQQTDQPVKLRFRILLDQCGLTVNAGRSGLAARSLEGIVIPGEDGTWRAKLKSELSGRDATAERVSCRWNSDLSFDPSTGTLTSRNNLRRLRIGTTGLEDADFVLKRTNTAWRIRGFRMADSLSLEADWTAQGRLFFDAVFRRFEAPFSLPGGPWVLDGRVSLTERSSLTSKLSCSAARRRLDLEIASGKIRNLQYLEDRRKAFVLLAGENGTTSGWIKDVDLGGRPFSAEFEYNTDARVFKMRRAVWGSAVVWKDYLVTAGVAKDSVSLSSLDRTFSALLSSTRPLRSWIRFDLSSVPFGRVFGDPSARVTGLVDLRYPVSTLSDSVVDPSGKAGLTNLSLRFDFRSNSLALNAAHRRTGSALAARFTRIPGGLGLIGRLSAGRNSIRFTGWSSADKSGRKIEIAAAERLRCSVRIDRSRNVDLRFNAPRQAGRKINVWSAAGGLSGNIGNRSSWQGDGSVRIERLTGSGFSVPSVELAWQMDNNRTLEWSLTAAGRDKKHTATGFVYWGAEPRWNASFNGLTAEGSGAGKYSTSSVVCRNFDLGFLNDLADEKTRGTVSGALDLRFGSAGAAAERSLQASLTNIHWSKFECRRILLSGRFSRGQFELQPSRITLPDGEIRLVGLAAVGGAGPAVSLSADLKLRNASGVLGVVAQDISGVVDMKFSFFNARVNNIPIDRYTQYVRWNRTARSIAFYAEDAGLNGSVYLPAAGTRPDYRVAVDLTAAGSRVIGLTGSVSKSGRLDLRTGRFSLPMKSLVFLIPTCVSAEGLLQGELRVGGTRAAPLFYGDVGLDSGRMKLAESLDELKDLGVKLKFDGPGIGIDRCRATIDGKPVEITGNAEIGASGLRDYEFRLTMRTNDSIYLKSYNDIQGWIWADIRVSQEEGMPLVEGKIRLKNLDFTYPFLGPPPRKRPPLLLDLELLAGNNVNYFQNVNNILVRVNPGGNLRLQGLFRGGTPADRKLTGEVTSSRGRMDYLGTTFQVRRVRLVFAEEYDSVRPYLELAAETSIASGNQTYLATLQGRGVLMKDFNVNPSTVPSLTRQEIVSLLGYGRLYEKILLRNAEGTSEVDVTNPTEGEANALLLAGVLTYFQEASQNALIKPLTRRIRKILNVDKLEVTTSLDQNLLLRGFSRPGQQGSFTPFLDSFNSTQLVIGKYFTEYLFVEYMLYSKKNDFWKNRTPEFDNFHQLRLELDLKGISFDWKFRPFIVNPANPSGKNEMEGEIKWQKTF